MCWVFGDSCFVCFVTDEMLGLIVLGLMVYCVIV